MLPGESGRQNARHRFISHSIAGRPVGCSARDAFLRAVEAWSTAEPKAKAKAKASASLVRNSARAMKLEHMSSARAIPVDLPSLWDIGRGSQFPLSLDRVRAMLSTKGLVSKLATAWATRANERRPASLGFPAIVPFRRILPVILPPLEKQCVNEIMIGLQLLFGKRGTQMDKNASRFDYDVILIKHSSGLGTFVQPCSLTKQPAFEVKLLVLKEEHSDNAFCVFEAGARVLVPVGRTLSPGIAHAAELVARVREHLPGTFVFQRVTLAEDHIPGPPGAIAVTDLGQEVNLAELQEKNRNDANVCRTLRSSASGCYFSCCVANQSP